MWKGLWTYCSNRDTPTWGVIICGNLEINIIGNFGRLCLVQNKNSPQGRNNLHNSYNKKNFQNRNYIQNRNIFQNKNFQNIDFPQHRNSLKNGSNFRNIDYSQNRNNFANDNNFSKRNNFQTRDLPEPMNVNMTHDNNDLPSSSMNNPQNFPLPTFTVHYHI